MPSERSEREGYKVELNKVDTSVDTTSKRIHESLQIDGTAKPALSTIKEFIARITPHARRNRNPNPKS